MKKTKIILLLCIALVDLGLSNASGIDKIKVHLVIGRLSRNCKGLGFCYTEVIITRDSKLYDGMQDLDDKSLNGTVMINQAKELEFDIDKETGITREAYEQFFSSGAFVFDEDFEIPDEILELLNHPDKIIIRAGKYAIIDEDEMIKLVIAN